MSSAIVGTKTNTITFGKALELFSAGNAQTQKQINELATSIIQKTVRSSDENYQDNPFISLIELVYRLSPNIDLVKTPMSAQSILDLIQPDKSRLVFRS